jgi:hypothetical protein
MALHQSRVISRSIPSLTRCYASSNVPVKVSPPGLMHKPDTPESSVSKVHPPVGGEYKSQGTSVGRTIRNIWKAGLRRAFWQIKEMNDTKVIVRCTLLIKGWYISWNRQVCISVKFVLTVVWETSIMKIWANCLCVNVGLNILNPMNMIVLKLNRDGIRTQ